MTPGFAESHLRLILHAFSFDLSVSLPNIWTLLHFHTIASLNAVILFTRHAPCIATSTGQIYFGSPLVPNRLTDKLTPRCRVLLENLRTHQPVQKLLKIYGTQWFITVLTTARHSCLSWNRLIQSTPSHPTSLTYILILSSHLPLGFSTVPVPSCFHNKTVYALFFLPFLPHGRPISSCFINQS